MDLWVNGDPSCYSYIFTRFGHRCYPIYLLQDGPAGKPTCEVLDMADYDPTDPKWDSDAALENVKMERSVMGDLSNEALTRKMLEDAAPQAAQSIIHLALHATNENTRLNASRYITDNLINEGATAAKAKWEDLVGEAVSEAELHANNGVA